MYAWCRGKIPNLDGIPWGSKYRKARWMGYDGSVMRDLTMFFIYKKLAIAWGNTNGNPAAAVRISCQQPLEPEIAPRQLSF